MRKYRYELCEDDPKCIEWLNQMLSDGWEPIRETAFLSDEKARANPILVVLARWEPGDSK